MTQAIYHFLALLAYVFTLFITIGIFMKDSKKASKTLTAFWFFCVLLPILAYWGKP